jgi:hypothetical protein
MISKDLQQSLNDLQLAVLEKLARKDGNAISHDQLSRMIERGGIVRAFDDMRRTPTRPAPQLSIFSRLTQRWFGRT